MHLNNLKRRYIVSGEKREEAIILDFYGTIGREDELSPELPEGPLRKNIKEFLKYQRRKGRKIIIFTDYPYPNKDSTNEKPFIEKVLAKHGIINYVDRFYTASDCTENWLKDLSKVSKDLNIPCHRMVFIGNGNRDALSAQFHSISFIKVPTYFKRDNFDFLDTEFLKSIDSLYINYVKDK